MPVCAPNFVVDKVAPFVASSITVSKVSPLLSWVAKMPLNVSPAPVVSTTFAFHVGIVTTFPFSTNDTPFDPRVTISLV